MGGYDSFSRLHNKWMDKKMAHSYNEPQHWWQTTAPFWPSRPLFACSHVFLHKLVKVAKDRACFRMCETAEKAAQFHVPQLYVTIKLLSGCIYSSWRMTHIYIYIIITHMQCCNEWTIGLFSSCPFHWVNAPVYILTDDHLLEACYDSRIATWTPRKLIWQLICKSRLQVQQWHQPPTPAFRDISLQSFTCPPNMEGWIIPLLKKILLGVYQGTGKASPVSITACMAWKASKGWRCRISESSIVVAGHQNKKRGHFFFF